MRIHSKLLGFLATTIPSLMMVACSSPPPHSQVSAMAGYVDAKSLPSATGAISPIRLQALREGATTLGARGALAWRAEHINAALKQENTDLDHIFDFNQLLLNQNVLPPVLVESNSNLTLDSNDALRTANKTYEIVAKARLVTASPTWRTYLWMSFSKPDVPSKSLLPTTDAEAYVWDEYLKRGWKEGLKQANDIFSANLSRLKRDYLGMVLYRKLLEQGMISSPVVATAKLGITGDKNRMRINDAITRITSHSVLELDSKQWKPILTK